MYIKDFKAPQIMKLIGYLKKKYPVEKWTRTDVHGKELIYIYLQDPEARISIEMTESGCLISIATELFHFNKAKYFGLIFSIYWPL